MAETRPNPLLGSYRFAKPSAPLVPTELASSGPWTVLFLPGASSDLVLSCASIGHSPSRAPSPEWVRTATAENRPAIFLLDRARSWATAPGLDEVLRQALATLCLRKEIRRILAIGTSLGAFTALAASQSLPLDALIAIGPQHQPAAPWETRWRTWTASLPETLCAPISRAQHTYILHGADDQTQALGFRNLPSADHLFFPNQSHATLAQHLKPAMPSLIAAAFAQDRRRVLRLTTQAGGQRFFAEKPSTR